MDALLYSGTVLRCVDGMFPYFHSLTDSYIYLPIPMFHPRSQDLYKTVVMYMQNENPTNAYSPSRYLQHK